VTEKRQDRLEMAFGSEAVPYQIGLGGDDRVGRPFVGGQLADKLQQ